MTPREQRLPLRCIYPHDSRKSPIIIGLVGGPGAASAEELVSNLSGMNILEYALNEKSVAQAFTTGSNVSGYRLESISIHFTGGAPLLDTGVRQSVYVYLQEDNGGGQPNLAQGGQVATLSKNGVNVDGPTIGLNKYRVWKARCYPQGNAGGCMSDASSVHLDPNTRYWVYIWATDSRNGADITSTVLSETGASGWTIADTALTKPSSGSSSGIYNWTTDIYPISFKVDGETNPPVKVSISDVTVTEGVELTADFVVSLDRATSGVVTTEYWTSDENEIHPATKNVDYEDLTFGKLTFQPGETQKTVSIPIFDDAVAEGQEKFNLVLANITGATFSDRKGVGIIENAEPLTDLGSPSGC